jgi:hypothetical protein
MGVTDCTRVLMLTSLPSHYPKGYSLPAGPGANMAAYPDHGWESRRERFTRTCALRFCHTHGACAHRVC